MNQTWFKIVTSSSRGWRGRALMAASSLMSRSSSRAIATSFSWAASVSCCSTSLWQVLPPRQPFTPRKGQSWPRGQVAWYMPLFFLRGAGGGSTNSPSDTSGKSSGGSQFSGSSFPANTFRCFHRLLPWKPPTESTARFHLGEFSSRPLVARMKTPQALPPWQGNHCFGFPLIFREKPRHPYGPRREQPSSGASLGFRALFFATPRAGFRRPLGRRLRRSSMRRFGCERSRPLLTHTRHRCKDASSSLELNFAFCSQNSKS